MDPCAHSSVCPQYKQQEQKAIICQKAIHSAFEPNYCQDGYWFSREIYAQKSLLVSINMLVDFSMEFPNAYKT